MSPFAATFLSIFFIATLFLLDWRKKYGTSSATLIPMLWMFFAGGRYFSQWITLSSGSKGVASYAEGSPLDAAMFSFLIAGALVILAKRGIAWGEVLSRNKLLCAYFLYCALSSLWSDFPLIALKRLVKDLGNPLMALVILTDRDALAALGTILRRLAYLWIPLSYLFSKYLPELGRGFHNDGTMMVIGIGGGKNDLGLMCLITGIYFASTIFQPGRWSDEWRGLKLLANGIVVAMLAWLLVMSDSQTSLACLIVAMTILGLSRVSIVASRPTRIMNVVLTAAVGLAILEWTTDFTNHVFELLGRDPSLTDRVPIWRILIGMAGDPWWGAGYESFWLGDRPLVFQGTYGSQVNQAHNGYLEQYLNLGYFGVAFIVLIVLSALLRVRATLKTNYSLAVLQFVFIAVSLISNYTEASFYGVNNLWLLLLLSAISVPGNVSEQRGDRQTINSPQVGGRPSIVPRSAHLKV